MALPAKTRAGSSSPLASSPRMPDLSPAGDPSTHQAKMATHQVKMAVDLSDMCEVLRSGFKDVAIPECERTAGVSEVKIRPDKDLPVERTLGVQWNVEHDFFSFSLEPKDKPCTRRGILSTVASVFDPLGLLAPFVLIGKSILQIACRGNLSWDEPLFEELWPRWEKWLADLSKLKDVHVPRCYRPVDFKSTTTELHHFMDASNVGYGVCSYLHFVKQASVHCSLVAGKARVAPSKLTTIPRLELTAAVVAVKLSLKIKEEL